MSEQREPSVLRYPLAVIACAATFCLWVPVLALTGWFIFTYLDDWVNRQVWVLEFALKCVLGCVLLAIFFGGWELTKWTWKRITQPPGALADGGQKYGQHAKWHPGYDPNPPAVEPENEHGHCPRCWQSSLWNGSHCGHCRYGED